MNPRKKLMQWFVVALAVAGFAAAAAQAGTRPAQRVAGDTSDVVSRYLRSHARPSDRVRSLGVNTAAAPGVFERYASAHPYGVGLTAATVTAAGGFRWGDYGAGVGTGIGVVLLLLAGAFLAPTRRRQRTQPAIGR